MNEKKKKISTCVYVHSIFHHWACILMFEGHFIKYVDGSSYVSFPRPFIICIHVSYILRVK